MKNLLFLFLLFNLEAITQTPAIVKAVHDGDSYKVWFFGSGNVAWIRLVSVDCPEVISNRISKNQPMGVQIGDTCRKLLLNDTVIIKTYGYDGYGRLLAQLNAQFDLGNGIFDISEWLLLNGYAVYLTSSKVHPIDRIKYRQCRDSAKINKLGIWADPGQLTPHDWRKQYKRKSKTK